MNRLEQRRILNQQIEQIEKKVFGALRDKKIPKDWDEVELSALVADVAQKQSPDWNKILGGKSRSIDYDQVIKSKSLI